MLPFIRLFLVTFFLRLLAILPLPLNHVLGGLIGHLYYFLPNRLRDVTHSNIKRCYPDKSAPQQQALIRASLKEVGKTLSENGPLWYWPEARILKLVTDVQGKEHLLAGLQRGKGIIIAAPHLGSWEILGHYLNTLAPITNLYRPPRLPEFDSLIQRVRTRFGAKLAPTTPQGIKALFQLLRNNECVGILPDQDPGRGGAGIFAPFFGTPANTMSLLPRLAQKTGAQVIFGFAERLPRGRGYRLHFIPAHPDVGSRDLAVATNALNQGVEHCVRLIPEQYQWGYKRFRTRPEGEKKIY